MSEVTKGTADSWEIGVVREGPFNKSKQTRYGPMLYNRNDMYVGRSLDLYGEFSELECHLFRQIIRPGDVVFDIGANIGAHTVFYAQAVGATGIVFAFEPQRLVFQTLCANLALNSLDRVWAFNMALGERDGMITVPDIEPRMVNNFGGLSINTNSPGNAVPIMRLDSIEVPSCRLIKIDVEGMEIDVLRGATGLIAKYRPFLYVEADREDKRAELLRFIASLGYRMYWHLPPLYNPENFFGNAENVFGKIVSINVICAPPEVEMHGFEAVKLP